MFQLLLLPIGGGLDSAVLIGIWDTRAEALKDMGNMPTSVDYALMVKEAK